MEMLTRIPDMNSTSDGGWLFEYQEEPLLKDEPVVSHRWRLRSSHKINAPVTVEGKRHRLELMLRPENIR